MLVGIIVGLIVYLTLGREMIDKGMDPSYALLACIIVSIPIIIFILCIMSVLGNQYIFGVI